MRDDLNDIEPREYQEEANEWALSHEQGVVCLPTGTGKTLVGCLWTLDLLNQTDVERVLVIEPSRFLVEQTHAYYERYTTIPTIKLDGTTAPPQRRGQWTEGRVVVTTPQTAVNDADHLDCDAVIVDECHHTTGQHACAQLLDRLTVRYKLGLSATIPADRESEIAAAIGPVRRRSWTDLPDEHVPDWIGHIYDTAYPARYRDVVSELEQIRQEVEGSRIAGLPSLAIRMLYRDGALALEETLSKPNTMADLLGDRVRPTLSECQPLHKLDACRTAFADHDFEKAVLFVDRVAVARRLSELLEEYTTVSLLGRLHSSRTAQEAAVERAQSDETDLIIATAAGEEGIDLPAADLLVVWSNVVSSVRFIQRLGRIMRPSGSDAPRNAIYLATPDSPDYEALRRGVAEAQRAGLDVAHVDAEAILSRSIVGRVQDVLEGTPRQRETIAQMLSQPDGKVDRWLRTNVREGDVLYLYAVPDDLNEWRADSWMGVKLDPDKMDDSLANNFAPTAQDRYYCREDDLHIIRTDYSHLVRGSHDHHLKVEFGPTTAREYRAMGRVEAVTPEMHEKLQECGADGFYANVSYSSYQPKYSFQMTYQGSTSNLMIRTTLQNADAIADTLDERVST